MISKMDTLVDKIISGGQTGADRAALDWAIAIGVSHGGWCPKGRKAEDGEIDGRYNLRETPSADYPQRTEWNVRDSDGTGDLTTCASVLSGDAQGQQRLLSNLHAPAEQLVADCWVTISRFAQALAEKGTLTSVEAELAIAELLRTEPRRPPNAGTPPPAVR